MSYRQARSPYRGPLQAVLLDWAGTTVDYGCQAPMTVFRRVFEQHGVAITKAEARAPMGRAKQEQIAVIAQMPRVAAAWEAAHGAPPGPADLDRLFAEAAPLLRDAAVEHAALVPGTLELVAACQAQNLRIGSSTGYGRTVMDALVPAAAAQGYTPDAVVCASDVPAGRPAPWMAFLNAIRLEAYPMAAWVKVGDTVADVEEGLNAGMWTVGVVLSGSLLGLSAAEVAALSPAALQEHMEPIVARLAGAGAHYVVGSVADLPATLDAIAARLADGEAP